MYEATINTSCHTELLPGTLIRSEKVEEELGYQWMVVKLSNGVNRDVIIKDVKQL